MIRGGTHQVELGAHDNDGDVLGKGRIGSRNGGGNVEHTLSVPLVEYICWRMLSTSRRLDSWERLRDDDESAADKDRAGLT